jgi:hypothetical protein
MTTILQDRSLYRTQGAPSGSTFYSEGSSVGAVMYPGTNLLLRCRPSWCLVVPVRCAQRVGACPRRPEPVRVPVRRRSRMRCIFEPPRRDGQTPGREASAHRRVGPSVTAELEAELLDRARHRTGHRGRPDAGLRWAAQPLRVGLLSGGTPVAIYGEDEMAAVRTSS